MLIKRACCLLLITALSATTGLAQNKRRDDLARVQELVNDPDPLQRIANFEDIVAENDASKLQIAIQTAMTGNDATLRGLAFRAFIGGVPRFVADMKLDPALQKKVDAVSPDQHRKEFGSVTGLLNLLGTGMRVDIKIDEFDVRSGRGQASFSYNTGNKTDITVTGDRLIGRTQYLNGTGYPCIVELRPTRDVTLEGTMVCDNVGFGRVRLSAPMF
jgi:hypothetical protein